MDTNYTYLDQAGLATLVESLKAYISEADIAVLQDAKTDTDSKIAIVTAAVEKAQKAADDAKSAADKAQGDVDALLAKVGTVPDEKTVMSIIDEIQKAAYDDSAIKEEISNLYNSIDSLKETQNFNITSINKNTAAIEKLNGSGEGSVEQKINAAINKFATDVTDDEVVNSYKELIDWVVTHGAEATEMAAGIQANKTSLDDLKKLVGSIPEGITATTIVELINEVVGKEQARAEGVESGLDTRLKAVESKVGESGSIADDIAKAKQEAITEAATTAADAKTKADKALEDANAYTDVAVEALKTAVAANAEEITGIKEQVNTTLPASIKDAQDAADAAQADVDGLKPRVAKNETDVAGITTRVNALEADTHTHTAITKEYIQGLFQK